MRGWGNLDPRNLNITKIMIRNEYVKKDCEKGVLEREMHIYIYIYIYIYIERERERYIFVSQ